MYDRDYYLEDNEGDATIVEEVKSEHFTHTPLHDNRTSLIHGDAKDSDTEIEDEDMPKDDGEMSGWFNSQDVDEAPLSKSEKDMVKPEPDSDTDPDSDYDEARAVDEDGEEQTLDELADNDTEMGVTSTGGVQTETLETVSPTCHCDVCVLTRVA